MDIVDEAWTLLEAATPGPWCTRFGPGFCGVAVGDVELFSLADSDATGGDVNLVAAAPRLVTGLLAEVKRLFGVAQSAEESERKAVTTLQEHYDNYSDVIRERDEARAELMLRRHPSALYRGECGHYWVPPDQANPECPVCIKIDAALIKHENLAWRIKKSARDA